MVVGSCGSCSGVTAMPRRTCGFLLVASLVFYGWHEPVYLLILLFTCIVDFVAGLMLAIETRTPFSRRAILFASLADEFRGAWASSNTTASLPTICVTSRRPGRARPVMDPAHRRDAAGGHFVLHLPKHELHDRRLPGRGTADAELLSLPAVRVILSAARRRPDRAGARVPLPVRPTASPATGASFSKAATWSYAASC